MKQQTGAPYPFPSRDSGQSSIVIVLVIALMALVVAGAISFSSGSLESHSAGDLALIEAQTFENQLNTIVSNSQLCDQKVLISATTSCGSTKCGTFSIAG